MPEGLPRRSRRPGARCLRRRLVDHADLGPPPEPRPPQRPVRLGRGRPAGEPQQPGAKVKLDKIVEATVVRKRAHPYEPKALPEPNRGPGRAREKTRDE